jgi:hypothetical protein
VPSQCGSDRGSSPAGFGRALELDTGIVATPARKCGQRPAIRKMELGSKRDGVALSPATERMDRWIAAGSLCPL